MMMRGSVSVLWLCALSLSACGARSSNPDVATQSNTTRAAETTVLLARHAERASQAANSDLAPAGFARAELLTAIAREARVAAILTTDFCRTAQTGQPVALNLGLPLEVMQTGNANAGLDGCTPPITVRTAPESVPTAEGIANRIKRNYAGRAVLVIGHANTIPQIAAALGAPLCPQFLAVGNNGQCQIPETDYHDLFLVKIAADGAVAVEHRRYGPGS
jgi:broad specificity phosphatase PhoE